MCVLPTANWYIYVPPGLVSCPWGRKINEVSPYTDVPKGGKVNWKELGCFINFKRGCSAPSTCLSWIPKMKGLPPQRKATQESCQPAADPYDLSVETPWAQKSDKEKEWWQSHPQSREHGIRRGVCLPAPVISRSWWSFRLTLTWRLYSCG